MAFANLSSIVKCIVIQSHNKFQQIALVTSWLNVSLRNYSGQCAITRKLEFSLLQMIHQFDELIVAIQFVMQDIQPIGLINPTNLQGILRNISFQLPEGYEFIVGTKPINIYLQYEVVQVSVIGDIHIIKRFINVSLRTASIQFLLYKVAALPTSVKNQFS